MQKLLKSNKKSAKGYLSKHKANKSVRIIGNQKKNLIPNLTKATKSELIIGKPIVNLIPILEKKDPIFKATMDRLHSYLNIVKKPYSTPIKQNKKVSDTNRCIKRKPAKKGTKKL